MLYFEMQNVRGFIENTLLQTIPNKKQTKFKNVYLKKQCGNSYIDVLPFTVIHGPNASGKSTIIRAMELLKEIVLSGKIYSDDPKMLLYNIGLYPFLHDYNRYVEPMKLAIGFVADNKKYEYSLTIIFTMPQKEYSVNKEIIEEVLYVDDMEIFHRTATDIAINDKGKTIIKKIGIDEAIAPEELYLYGGFKSNIETNRHFQSIINWFRFDLIIIFDVNSLKVNIEAPKLPQGSSLDVKNDIIDAALKTADFGPQKLFYKLSNTAEGNSSYQIRSLYSVKNFIGQGIETNAQNTESNGTLKLIDISMLIISALINGSTLIIDEFDSSFHIAMIKELVSLFTNKEINKKAAQLIFTSHNIALMSLTKIRKDQIYFVEKDQNSHSSSLYSLSDFKTNSETDVRNGEQYINNYLAGKYGAFPTFKFEDAVMDYLEKTKIVGE